METTDTFPVSSPQNGVDPDAPTERIILHAAARFREEGIGRITVDELCADLRMSKKTFYKSFTSKDALVDAIASRIMTDVERRIGEIIYGDRPFVAKVDGMMALMAETFRRMGRILMLDLQRLHPAVWSRIQAFRRERVLRNVADLMAQGKRQGTIRPHINVRVFTLAYLGAIEAVLVPPVLENESFSAEEALRSILTIFFSGVLTDEAAHELHRLQQSQLRQEHP